MNTNTYTLREFDVAIDFAYAYKRDIEFCKKMVRYFEVVGNLTPGQVHALLRLKDQL